jgi:hypothetical protein
MSKHDMAKREFLQMKRAQFKILMNDLKDFSDTSDREDFTFGKNVEDYLQFMKSDLDYIHSVCKDIWKKA